MKAVIGLGNPGIEYEGTRHNVGFSLLDGLLQGEGLAVRRAFRGRLTETRLAGEKIFFFKPYTYMNLSGQAVVQLADYYRLAPEDLLVVHDDMDLPLGRIRLRSKGSAGGHNGLKSIIGELDSQNFWRLKIGVGRPAEADVVNHVLSHFKKEEREVIAGALDKGRKVVELWLRGQGEEAMSLYNRQE